MNEHAANATNVKRLTTLGILTAVSIVLVYLVRFPIFPSAAFLEYDMADVPILIGTFLFGVPSGLMLTFLVSVIQGMTVSAGSGWVGIVMHIFSTSAFVTTTGAIYAKGGKTIQSALIGLIAGTVVMAAVMVPLNLIFIVHFYGVPQQAVMAMLVPVIIPFNLIKAGLNSVVSFLVFKGAEKVLKGF